MTKHHWNILFLILGVTCSLAFLPVNWNWISTVLVLIIFSSQLAYGISVIDYNYFFKAINKLENNQVLLTFDDGPHPIYTEKILEILEKHKIAALFFTIGKNVDQHPELVQKTITKGHRVANHTYNHPNNFALLKQKCVQQEIEMGKRAIQAFEGASYNLFRTPIGVTNPIIARALKQTKVTPIGWTIRTKDTIKQDQLTWLSSIIQKTKPNEIVLFHDTQAMTAEYLDQYILECQKRGIEFVNTNTIKQLFHA